MKNSCTLRNIWKTDKKFAAPESFVKRLWKEHFPHATYRDSFGKVLRGKSRARKKENSNLFSQPNHWLGQIYTYPLPKGLKYSFICDTNMIIICQINVIDPKKNESDLTITFFPPIVLTEMKNYEYVSGDYRKLNDNLDQFLPIHWTKHKKLNKIANPLSTVIGTLYQLNKHYIEQNGRNKCHIEDQTIQFKNPQSYPQRCDDNSHTDVKMST